jgi:3-isopropylmalate/(R)-2-methylmalate dehydratase small subunit
MTSLTINGPARLVGADINTDYIISSRRKRVTIDPDALRLYIFEDYDAEFGQSLKPDDIIVAGKNFGCGSAMEVAVTVVRAAGISCVLAPSFARAYYRNAINNGLLPVVCDTSSIQEDDTLSIVSEGNDIHVTNTSRDISIGAASLSSMMIEILKTGGLTEYLRKHGDFPSEI